MGISSKIGLVLTRAKRASMRAFIVCLAIATVSGDAKPYTLAQVAAGLPVQNAAADGRLHNIGVVTNAGAAGVKTVGALAYTAPVHTYIHGYGKRDADAEPYTLGQVYHGQTAGGVVTGVDYGHGSGLVPATAVTHTVPYVYAGYPFHYFG